MKPSPPIDSRPGRFPFVDSFFRGGLENWRGYAAPHEDDDRRAIRNFHDLRREFLTESAHERAREMAVFAVVMAVAAWPVVYMVITVVELLLKGRPLQ